MSFNIFKSFILYCFFLTQLFANNEYPIILVHGFLGWGKDEVGKLNYWGGKNDIEQHLIDRGYKVFSVSLGPISSAYECAIETYYQLKGGQLDYGKGHSENYDIIRKPKEKNYVGLYPEWNENNPVHLLGYSFGGITTRMLLHLLNNVIEDTSGLKESSQILGSINNGWIKSITTMSTPHNGSTLSNIVIDAVPFTDNLLPIANMISSKYYNFDLEHWNLSKLENETIVDYIKRLTKHPAWSTKNSVAWDSSIQGAQELNNILIINPDVYYFSSSTSASFLDTSSGYHHPAEFISIMSYPWSWLIGRTNIEKNGRNITDSNWYENDGTVNTISMARPYSGKNGAEPLAPLTNTNKLETGTWYHIGKFHYDHKAFIGHFLDDPEKINEIKLIFENHAKVLYQLP